MRWRLLGLNWAYGIDDVLASGRFGLVRDTAIRVRIADHHEWTAGQAERIEERETINPNLSYQLVPRKTEFELAADLDKSSLEVLVERVFSSPLPDHVVGEQNFTQFLGEVFGEWKAVCLELIEQLEQYRAAITN